MKENNKLLQSIIEGIQEKKGKNITQIQLKGIPEQFATILSFVREIPLLRFLHWQNR